MKTLGPRVIEDITWQASSFDAKCVTPKPPFSRSRVIVDLFSLSILVCISLNIIFPILSKTDFARVGTIVLHLH